MTHKFKVGDIVVYNKSSSSIYAGKKGSVKKVAKSGGSAVIDFDDKPKGALILTYNLELEQEAQDYDAE
ncbi:hypothetical protein [Paenilisteria rocourtiae]|uniref:Uncharacterized protein n=1 Tax=Listeria rocourtiae TaxID=647910 RepID=A0A4R6ZNV9_9LIST|nr:hypothetical protein [Listeria rocourtiae]TDR54210.1 hypothetical protein DFP96_103311 [Listeria rocourtiae]